MKKTVAIIIVLAAAVALIAQGPIPVRINYGGISLSVPRGAGAQIDGTIALNNLAIFSAGSEILLGTTNGEPPKVRFGDGYEGVTAEIELMTRDGRPCRMVFKSGWLAYSSCR